MLYLHGLGLYYTSPTPQYYKTTKYNGIESVWRIEQYPSRRLQLYGGLFPYICLLWSVKRRRLLDRNEEDLRAATYRRCQEEWKTTDIGT
jgi:hypothetical protein